MSDYLKRIANKVVDSLIDHWVGAIFVVVVGGGGAFAYYCRMTFRFLSDEIRIPVYVLIVFSLMVLVLFIVTVFFSLKHLREDKPYRPIEVYADRFNACFRIQYDPKEWIEEDLMEYPPGHIDSILNGPLCAKCKWPIGSKYDSGLEDYVLDGKCGRCQEVASLRSGGKRLRVGRRLLKSWVCLALQTEFYRRKRRYPKNGDSIQIISSHIDGMPG